MVDGGTSGQINLTYTSLSAPPQPPLAPTPAASCGAPLPDDLPAARSVDAHDETQGNQEEWSSSNISTSRSSILYPDLTLDEPLFAFRYPMVMKIDSQRDRFISMPTLSKVHPTKLTCTELFQILLLIHHTFLSFVHMNKIGVFAPIKKIGFMVIHLTGIWPRE
jgi:hypothetical protein